LNNTRLSYLLETVDPLAAEVLRETRVYDFAACPQGILQQLAHANGAGAISSSVGELLAVMDNVGADLNKI